MPINVCPVDKRTYVRGERTHDECKTKRCSNCNNYKPFRDFDTNDYPVPAIAKVERGLKYYCRDCLNRR